MNSNGTAPGGYPPPPAHAAAGGPPGDAALRQQVVTIVNEIAALDALIADADTQLQLLPDLVAWMVRVRHSVLWLLCLPRDQVAAGLTFARAVPGADLTAARRRRSLLPAWRPRPLPGQTGAGQAGAGAQAGPGMLLLVAVVVLLVLLGMVGLLVWA